MSLRQKILDRMEKLGLEPKRSLGQNFLISEVVVDRIIEACEFNRFEKVIEIGPGLGALTDPLIEGSARLTLMELDSHFSQYWREERSQEVIEGDALQFDWANYTWGSSLLVSNLPYQISSRLVVELSLLPQSFDRMVLMFQKEVAKRILAQPRTQDYGLLTVVSQNFWEVKAVLEAGAIDFFPKPNVASRVVCFDRKEVEPLFCRPDYLNFLKNCFQQKGKKMRLPWQRSNTPTPDQPETSLVKRLESQEPASIDLNSTQSVKKQVVKKYGIGHAIFRPLGIAIALLIGVYASVAIFSNYWRGYQRDVSYRQAYHIDKTAVQFFQESLLSKDKVELIIRNYDGQLEKRFASNSQLSAYIKARASDLEAAKQHSLTQMETELEALLESFPTLGSHLTTLANAV